MNERQYTASLPSDATPEQYADFLQSIIEACQPDNCWSALLVIDNKSETGNIHERGKVPLELRLPIFQDAVIYHGVLAKKEKADG